MQKSEAKRKTLHPETAGGCEADSAKHGSLPYPEGEEMVPKKLRKSMIC